MDVDGLRELLSPAQIAWVDVTGLGDETVLRRIGEFFNLHTLLLEDVVNVPQRPKTEEYDGTQLIITRIVTEKEGIEPAIEQVSIVLQERRLVTFRERRSGILAPVRQRMRNEKGRIRNGGSDFLCYAVMDTVVDAYYPVLESLGEYLEALVERILRAPTPETLRDLTRVKTTLLGMRRAIWPQRETVNSLVRDENPLIADETRLYLRDTHDHCVQIAEVTDGYRELASGLMNTYLSVASNRTNEIMKVLTIMASIFIPLTFLAGIYGMNFEHMPELQAPWAYPLLILVMALTAVGMVAYFIRKGWIGERGE